MRILSLYCAMLLTLGSFGLEGASLQRPKPLLLLTYLALEGPTPRRMLAELFYGDVKDPLDSLTTALRYLRQHPEALVDARANAVSTRVECDALLLVGDLDAGRLDEATARYRGPFLATCNLPLGEELKDWVYTQQDRIAQRLRSALLDHAEAQGESSAGAKLAGRAWALTKDQGLDTEALNRLYRLLVRGVNPLAHEVRQFASEYGLPLSPPGKEAAGPQASGAPTPSTLPPNVQHLASRLEDLRYSTSGLALCIWGEPGIGKTWTAEKACQRLSFPCHQVSATLPAHLAPARLPRAGELPGWARTILANLAAAEPVALIKVADAVAAVLAGNAPVVLWVEDLHEANEEGMTFWTLLAESVRRSPGVGFLTTSRHPPPDSFGNERLPGLSRSGIKEMLETEAGGSLPPDAVIWIEEHAGSNPLFALEFYGLLRKRGDLWFDSRAWRWRIPTTLQIPDNVEALVSQSVRSLPLDGDTKTFMWAKALLPAKTPDALVSQAAGLDDESARRAAITLSGYGVIRGSDFIHPLYREVQTAILVPKERLKIAQRIATLLEASDPEQAAPFVADAGLSDEAACQLLSRAAHAALSRGRPGQAGEFFARAADYTEGASKRDLLLRAADCFKDGHTVRAQQLTERVLEADPFHAEATFLLARCLVLQGQGERAERIIHRLPEAARPWQAWFDQLVHLRAERNDYQGALSAWEAHPHHQATAGLDAIYSAAVALVNVGRYSDADALAARTLERIGLTPDERAVLLEVRGLVGGYTGHFFESLAFFDDSIFLLRQAGESANIPKLMRALRSRVTVYLALCRHHDAIRDTEEAMRLANKLGSGRDYAIAQAYLGVPLGQMGDYEGAEVALLESREVLRRVDAREHLSSCEAILSGVYLNWQRHDRLTRALPSAHSALRLAEELGVEACINNAYFYVAWAELIVGDVSKAYAYADRGFSASHGIGRRRAAALFLWLRGLAHERLGQSREALNDLDEAVTLADRLKLEVHKLHFLIDRDRLLGNQEAVLRHLDRLKLLGFVAFNIPARQRYLEKINSIPDP